MSAVIRSTPSAPSPAVGSSEEEELRVGRERDADLERAPVAVGKRLRANRFLAREPDVGEGSRRALARRRRARRIADRVEAARAQLRRRDQRVLERAVIVEEVHHLEGARDPEARDRARRKAGHSRDFEMSRAPIRAIPPGEHVKARGLAGPVRAHDPVDLAFRDVEGHVLQHDAVPEALREALRGRNALIGAASPRGRARGPRGRRA
jgi:hypothetical protein